MSEPKPAPNSHAHEIDPIKDGKLGEASKTLTDHYAKAKTAQLEKQATKEPPSNMSFARTVQLDGKETKMGAASNDLRSQFQAARTEQLAKMSKLPEMKAPAPAPGMRLAPGGQLQRDVDRPAHRKQLNDYDKHVKALADQAKSAQTNRGPSRGKDHDRER